MAKVGIVMGSDSDMPIMAQAADFLDKMGIDYEMTIISAPVSYTHLDVYKRQVPDSPAFPLAQTLDVPLRNVRSPARPPPAQKYRWNTPAVRPVSASSPHFQESPAAAQHSDAHSPGSIP